MVDWELTATTVYCRSAGDEVTLLVSADGTCRCTGRPKHDAAKSQGRRSSASPGCPRAECDIIIRYRQSLLGEEGPAR
jgi:hypothetical protein